MRLAKNDNEITTIESWLQHAGPKGKERQWTDGRSAKELARMWCSTGSVVVPSVITRLFSHPDFGSLEFLDGEPEARIEFDQFGGEPRNSDLVIRARDDRGVIGISIEAKADEPFGDRVLVALRAAAKRKAANPKSRGLERIRRLASTLLSETEDESLTSIADLRYQLLTATAGALAWAESVSATRAVLIVHEMTGSKT